MIAFVSAELTTALPPFVSKFIKPTKRLVECFSSVRGFIPVGDPEQKAPWLLARAALSQVLLKSAFFTHQNKFFGLRIT